MKNVMIANGLDWVLPLLGTPVVQVRTAALVLLLVLAATIDLRTLRIPNWLTLTGTLVGLSLSAAIAWQALGARWAVDGFLWALAGMAAGLALLLPLYALHVMGAGDVKLMAMVGAFLGLQQILPAVLCVFIAGGLSALVWAVYRRKVRRLTANAAEAVLGATMAFLSGQRPSLAVSASVGRLPYGVSIAAGTLAWLVVAQLTFK